MTQEHSFITIDPIDPEHKQILAAAIKGRDTDALNALRGNTSKPIRFITQWFLWAMMTHDCDQSNYVIICSPEVRQNLNRMEHTLTQPDESYMASRLPIPLDLYDFLL